MPPKNYVHTYNFCTAWYNGSHTEGVANGTFF